MRFLAVAWDVDGTLVDSEPLHHRALLAVCARFGLDLRHEPESRFCGVHINDVWLALRAQLPDTLSQVEWLTAIEAYYQANSDQLTPIPGSRETIARLAQMGVRQACVSNSCRRIVETNLRALGVLEQMEFLVTLDDVQQGKPAPEPYLYAVTQFALPAAQVLAVEDSRTGVISAREAGLTVGGYGVTVSHDADVLLLDNLLMIPSLCTS